MPRKTHAGRPVYVVDGSRTPFLKVRGGPGHFRASDLALAAARPLLLRQPFPAEALDQVILGCVAAGADEANVARLVALRLGCGERMPAWTVQRSCASGLQALDSAAQEIAGGRSELVLAGGTEAMSHHPVLLNEEMVAWIAAWNRARGTISRGRLLGTLRPRHFRPVIALLHGLNDPLTGLSMGQTAEQLAWRFDITREAMDRFSLESHRRLAEARDQGRLDEIEPLFDEAGRLYDRDDGLRRESGLEKLAALQPAFDRPRGKVTAGNSAQISDGAAMLLLASERAAEQYGLTPVGQILDCQWAALEPSEMGLGPVHALGRLLQKQRLGSEEIDYWEINEAFAAQVLACLAAWRDAGYMAREVGIEPLPAPIPEARLNVDGGAISLGHPLGASGARLVLHLLKTLHHRQARRGAASLCIGGGQGGALLLERLP